MRFPILPFRDRIRKGQQVWFGGLNFGKGAADGELADMRNMTGDHAPLLATRGQRGYCLLSLSDSGEESITSIFAHEELCVISGSGFYYGGEFKGAVGSSLGGREFAALGDTVVIFPDKLYYNAYTDEFGSLDSVWSGDSLEFMNGKLFEVAACANAIRVEGVEWSDYFRAGDAVEISGCTIQEHNNRTSVIRDIDGDTMHFSENAFRLAGEDGDEPYEEIGEMRVARTVPDIEYVCSSGNRLWCCGGHEIYASKPGDVFNFKVFEGLASDSWAVDVGSSGEFTGAISYMGAAMFFKEGYAYRVMGVMPSNFELDSMETMGVQAGSSKSLAVVNGVLYYLSGSGVVAYSGGVPRLVGAAFGTERFSGGVSGSEGMKYFISMHSAGRGRLVYVYDVLRRFWHIEDDMDAVQFALWRGGLLALAADGKVWRMSGIPGALPEVNEPPFEWYAEFADWVDESPDKKGISSMQLRLGLDEGADAKVEFMVDSDGIWRNAACKLEPGRKRSYYLTIVPRRADHYAIRVSGTGGCRIYSLARERYMGSEK